MSYFRETLKQELSYKGIKVKELAEMTGISKHTIDHYLAENSSEPQVEAALKIARALNVSVEYLVTGCDAPVPKKISKDARSLIMELNYLGDDEIAVLKQLVKMIRK